VAGDPSPPFLSRIVCPPGSTPFPYPTLFRSEAIQHVMRDPAIDIVLMDIMMPDMDGIATIREIRKTPKGPELPIIAVTAKMGSSDRKSTRLNSSHVAISYAVSRLKKKARPAD